MSQETRAWVKGFVLTVIGITSVWCLIAGVSLLVLPLFGVHPLTFKSAPLEVLVGLSMTITGTYACFRAHKQLWVLNLERIDRQLAREDLAEASRNS